MYGKEVVHSGNLCVIALCFKQYVFKDLIFFLDHNSIGREKRCGETIPLDDNKRATELG